MEADDELDREALLKKIEQTRQLLAATPDNETLGGLTEMRLTKILRELEDKLRKKGPPPEQELGGGDICSLEREPSTEDDQPLD